MDVFSTQKRSEIMSRIRSAGTKPEARLYEIVSDALTELGGTCPVECRPEDLPGRPDVIIRCLRVAMFADGCFFHRCPKHGALPKTNSEYWLPKLEKNIRRDNAAARRLCSRGYWVWRFWEHDLESRSCAAVRRRVLQGIARRMAVLEIGELSEGGRTDG
jgi:DNA mismatch endonuclease (patch repair protein)